jgi:hypothetical protein
MPTLYLVYLDRAHLGDPTFLQTLAQAAHHAPTGEPTCLYVHGSGEKVERTLEAQGLFPERSGGVLQVESDDQRRLVERAVREVNHDIVGTLTDEVVPTVGVQGVDRSLLRLDDDGAVQVGTTGWLEAMIKQRVLPVVSALATTPDGTVREVWTAEAVVALARALQDAFDPTVVFFPKGTRSVQETEQLALADACAASAAADALRHVAAAGIPMLLTSADGLYRENGPIGAQIVP